MGNADALARSCKRSCFVLLIQVIFAVALILISTWAAVLYLERRIRNYELLGIDPLPPGIAFVTYDKRH